MRGRFFLATVTGVAFAASILSVAEKGAAKTAEELLAEINGLPEIERQARLEKDRMVHGNESKQCPRFDQRLRVRLSLSQG